MTMVSRESDVDPNTVRELAKVASQGCRYCHGQGVVAVYAPGVRRIIPARGITARLMPHR